MNVLITGGAGYIGTVLTEELLKMSNAIDKIYVLDNLSYKQESCVPFCRSPKYEFVYGDVRDTVLLDNLLKKVDLIFPLAAIVGFPACARNPRAAQEINCDHVKHIAQNSMGKRVIYPNTNSGYGATGSICTEETSLNPISIYGKTKCEAEKHILDNGHTSLRLATVFGTSYRFRKDLLVNDFTLKAIIDRYIVLFEPNFKRNYIHIRDVIKAMVHMMGIPRTAGTYNNGAIYSYRERTSVDMGGAVEGKLCFFDPSGEAYNVGLSSANLSKLELCEKIKEYLPQFDVKTSEYASDPDKRDYIVCNEKIEKTGWKPSYSLDDGIKELIKAYQIIPHVNTLHTNL
tara:strand:+ start:351 stop:1382 length:1032 start_codon:yes stop_codon:yes gene_type:complete